MKKIWAVSAVFLCLSGAYAQEIKIFGGGDWARYQGPPRNSWIPEISYQYGANRLLLFGLGVEVPVFGRFAADVGIQYFQKGQREDDYYLGTYMGQIVYRLDVLSLPACLKFKPFAKFPPYILAGWEASYVLRHRNDLPPSDLIIISGTNLIGGTRRFDFGFVAGGGAEFPVAARLAAFAELRYYLGLLNLDRSGHALRTRTLAVQAGISYDLSATRH
jgi:opacity protein-like surface antigen